MILAVPVSPDVEAKLRQRAATEGKDPLVYASRLLEQALDHSLLNDVLAPLRIQFTASGTTDDELIQQITEARTAYRNQH